MFFWDEPWFKDPGIFDSILYLASSDGLLWDSPKVFFRVDHVVSHFVDVFGVVLVLKPANRETDLILSRSMECDCRRGFGLDVGFIDHTTRNYT
jgi:hypothetical protein